MLRGDRSAALDVRAIAPILMLPLDDANEVLANLRARTEIYSADWPHLLFDTCCEPNCGT